MYSYADGLQLMHAQATRPARMALSRLQGSLSPTEE